MKIERSLGYVWASPLTLIAFLYTIPALLLGWYRWHGVRDDGLVFICKKTSPRWFRTLHRHRANSFGQVIVLRANPQGSTVSLNHELAHVRQMLVFGPFYPFVRLLVKVIMLLLVDTHPHYDNPFEIDARRRAGQYIDMPGLIEKIVKRRRNSYLREKARKSRLRKRSYDS